MPKKAKPKTQTKTKKTITKRPTVSYAIGKTFSPVASRLKRPDKKDRKPAGPNPGSAFGIFKQSISVVIEEWRFFLIALIIYTVLTIIFVKGISNTNFADLKTSLHTILHGKESGAKANLSLFGLLISTTGSTSSASASVYQTLLLFIFSLVTIWGLRHNFAAKKLRVKDALYKGLYPIIPFILICLTILIDTIPLFAGLFLYGITINDGVAVNVVEKIVWIVICGSLICLTIYFLTSSIFALYIVALPDVKPMQALRSARHLVRYRRWPILRKLLFLPVSLVIVVGIIIIPTIIFVPIITDWTFFVLSLMAVLYANTYLYFLYRDLLNE
jgi:hypothetical protein